MSESNYATSGSGMVPAPNEYSDSNYAEDENVTQCKTVVCGPYGDEGYDTNVDNDDLWINAKITAIHVHAGDIIDAITISYTNGSGERHGGSGGSTQTLQLDHDEYVVEVELVPVNYYGHDCIGTIIFKTNKGNKLSAGNKTNGEWFTVSNNDKALLTMTVYTASYVSGISFVFDNN